MNSKGFTLIELMATIAILALIMSIAIPSYNGISNAVKENQRNNIIKKIEIAASRYAFDTGETIIFVDKLVKEGYLESDKEDGTVNDPLNNGKLNCYIIKMEQEGNYFRSNFEDENSYENNGICDESKLEEVSENVYIQVTSNSTIVNDTTKWLYGNVELKAHSNNSLVIDCNKNKCEWFSSSGASSIGKDNYEITNNNVLESRYTFQYTIYDTNSSNIKRYKTSVNIKVDNIAPIIHKEKIAISDRYINTPAKSVKISASDGKGSGIVGYYLGNNSTICTNTSLTYQSSNEFLVTANGTYKICVKDGVGNVNSDTIVIEYISS